MKPYNVALANDTLTIENSRILRQYCWNGGNLISQKITDKQSGQVWDLTGSAPDFALPGVESDATDGKLTVTDIPKPRLPPPTARPRSAAALAICACGVSSASTLIARPSPATTT